MFGRHSTQLQHIRSLKKAVGLQAFVPIFRAVEEELVGYSDGDVDPGWNFRALLVAIFLSLPSLPARPATVEQATNPSGSAR